MSQSNSHSSSSPPITISPYERLHLIPNPDGTITRPVEFYPNTPPSLSLSSPSSLSLSRDVPVNPHKQTSLRLFLPKEAALNGSLSPSSPRLPIIVYAHGGGFILCSPASPGFHDFCDFAARELNALVVSVDYRLAPEHRLPAAYDDVLEALTWVKEGNDEWVEKYGDLSRCVLMGDSAGGNIVYHSGLRAADRIDDFRPLDVKALVLIQPYFGGPNRSGSEERLVDDPVLPLYLNEFMWGLALPEGVDRGHEFCDPGAGGGSGLLDRVRESGWWRPTATRSSTGTWRRRR